MEESYRILSVDKPGDPVWEAIGGGIQAHNIQHAGEDHGKRLCIVLYGPDQEVAGGLIGETYWNWLYISLMWLRDDLRGRAPLDGELFPLSPAHAVATGLDRCRSGDLRRCPASCRALQLFVATDLR